MDYYYFRKRYSFKKIMHTWHFEWPACHVSLDGAIIPHFANQAVEFHDRGRVKVFWNTNFPTLLSEYIIWRSTTCHLSINRILSPLGANIDTDDRPAGCRHLKWFEKNQKQLNWSMVMAHKKTLTIEIYQILIKLILLNNASIAYSYTFWHSLLIFLI